MNIAIVNEANGKIRIEREIHGFAIVERMLDSCDAGNRNRRAAAVAAKAAANGLNGLESYRGAVAVCMKNPTSEASSERYFPELSGLVLDGSVVMLMSIFGYGGCGSAAVPVALDCFFKALDGDPHWGGVFLASLFANPIL
ncbi:MAG: hypothetical protein LBI39_03225 [Puniceicoccales bacterium]|jgi:hypothetical protein|nr:hypothetical protein [Puniceicoccales bacterium]